MRQPPHHRLSDKAIAAWRLAGLRTSLLQLVLVVPALVLLLRRALAVAVIGGLEWVFVAVLLVGVAPAVRARTWRYEIGEHELYLQSGWLRITRHVVPLLRIQNVDTLQGPIDNLFGLASVSVSTAGGTATIPHLDEPVAQQLRVRIAERSRAATGTQLAHR
jgi:uncharacterized protein